MNLDSAMASFERTIIFGCESMLYHQQYLQFISMKEKETITYEDLEMISSYSTSLFETTSAVAIGGNVNLLKGTYNGVLQAVQNLQYVTQVRQNVCIFAMTSLSSLSLFSICVF